MSLLLYYGWHSVVNQIKKLFRTWVAIVILACFGIGLLAGLAGGLIGKMIAEREEELPAETEPETDEEIVLTDAETGEEILTLGPELILDIAATALGTLLLLLFVITAGKSTIFLPGDTVMLFCSPIKPQKVLLFRLVCQMGVAVFASIYLVFEMPVLLSGMDDLGVPTVPVIIGIAFAWIMLLVESVILKSLAFIFCAGDKKKTSAVQYGVYGVIAAALAGYVLFSSKSGVHGWDCNAVLYITSESSRFVPVVGWLKAVPLYAMEGNYAMMGLFAGINIVFLALVLFGVSRMKADYYEPALAKTEEYAQILAASQENRSILQKRKKDRSEKFRRNELSRGKGASVYFFKEMYNRSRFAFLGFFTKTFDTYAILSVGLTAVLRYNGVKMLLPGAAAIAVIAFYRTLGNPLEADTQLHFFSMIPEKTSKKLLWSVFAGLTNTMMDYAIPLAVCAVIAGASVWEAVGYFLLIASLDFYATNTSAFIGLSLPNQAGKNIKQFVQIMFLYFGIAPAAIAVGLGTYFGVPVIGLLIGTVFNVGTGFGMFAFLPLFL